MNRAPDHLHDSTSIPVSPAELQRQREALRRRLRRVNLASVLILSIVVSLAAGFVWKARDAKLEAERAHRATERAEAELWNSQFNEMRAERHTTHSGLVSTNRHRILDLAVRSNLSEDQRLALRQEAIAQMASVNIGSPAQSVVHSTAGDMTWNATLDRYLEFRPNGSIAIVSYPFGNVDGEIPARPDLRPQAATFSPDGRFAAVRYHGGEVRVWDLASTNVILSTRCVRLPNDPAPLLFLPNNQDLGMFTREGFVLQPLEQGRARRVLQGGRLIYAISITPDSRLLAGCPDDSRDTVEVWDLTTGEVRLRFQPKFVPTAVEWHPDGRRIAVSGKGGQLALWETRPCIGVSAGYHPREIHRFPGHLSSIQYVGVTPDGSMVNTWSWDGTSRFWDVMSGREVLRETRVVFKNVSSRGDRLLLTSANGGKDFISTFSPPKAFRTLAYMDGPRSAVGVWVSPDARLLAVSAAASEGEPLGSVSLWDFQRRVELARVPGLWAQFSRDGETLYTFAYNGIRRYDIRAATLDNLPSGWSEGTWLYPSRTNESVNTGELSEDGTTLVVAAMNHVIRLDANTGNVLGRFNGPAHHAKPSPDGSWILTSFQNSPSVIRDVKSGQALAQSKKLSHAVWSRDGNWIAFTEPKSVRLVRAATRQTISEIPMDFGPIMPPAAAFSPDSRWLAVPENRTDVRLIDVSTGKSLVTFSPPNPSQIPAPHGVEFSRDGRWLVLVRGAGDVVGWDLPEVGAELARLELGWDSPRRDETAAPVRTAAAPPSRRSILETAASAAVLLTMLGGLYAFAVQRRLLLNFERLETIALEQRRKLDSAQVELLHGQKMRALGTLAAGVAHDFNNLLSVIRLSNQLGAEQTKPTGIAKENVEAIESAVRHGENIVQSMLGYTRGAGDKQDFFAVDAVVNETVAMLGRKFLAGIILKLEIKTGLPLAFGSRSRLDQMLLNLIVNASEAMSGQGELSIRVRRLSETPATLLPPRRSDCHLELAVGDSGPGIPPDVLPRIFEPFFTTKDLSNRPGTGLGLATVYTMAEKEGFGLAVATGLGAGTTFRIFLPTTRTAESES